MKSARLYLVTINGKLPEDKAEEIKEPEMIVYVKDELKEEPHLKINLGLGSSLISQRILRIPCRNQTNNIYLVL